MACTTRRALTSDAAAACEVVRRSIIELCAEDHRDDPRIVEWWLANKTAANFEAWIASERDVALVAERAGQIVGFGLLEPSGLIALLYVSPDARFCGVSKALLAALEDEALAAGVREMRLDSSNTALRFYRSAGYSPSGDPRHEYCGTYCHPMSRKIGRRE